MVRVWNGISVNSHNKKKINMNKKNTQGEETLENSVTNSQDLDHRGFDISKRKGNSLEM